MKSIVKNLVILSVVFSTSAFSTTKLTKAQAADGAIKVAKWLHVNQEKDRADSFLKYALARDEKNRSALLYQAYLLKSPERIKADDITLSQIENYKNYLLLIAKKGKNEDIRLLHYKLVSFIDENDEDSLIALTAAQNDKVDTTYEVLHKKVFGLSKAEKAEEKEKEELAKAEKEKAEEEAKTREEIHREEFEKRREEARRLQREFQRRFNNRRRR